MHADSATTEVPTLTIPQDLLTEVSKRASSAKAKNDFRVEGWKPSLFGRWVEKLVTKGAERR
ncbi:MAG TPA: hypothetical protein VGM84_08020 [Steroidobacteraceae bacterium]